MPAACCSLLLPTTLSCTPPLIARALRGGPALRAAGKSPAGSGTATRETTASLTTAAALSPAASLSAAASTSASLRIHFANEGQYENARDESRPDTTP